MENLFHGRPELPELPVLDYVYLCRRLQRNIGMKGCREKPTRTERREPIEVFSLKTDYDTIFGSAGMWNAYGYRMG